MTARVRAGSRASNRDHANKYCVAPGVQTLLHVLISCGYVLKILVVLLPTCLICASSQCIAQRFQNVERRTGKVDGLSGLRRLYKHLDDSLYEINDNMHQVRKLAHFIIGFYTASAHHVGSCARVCVCKNTSCARITVGAVHKYKCAVQTTSPMSR